MNLFKLYQAIELLERIQALTDTHAKKILTQAVLLEVDPDPLPASLEQYMQKPTDSCVPKNNPAVVTTDQIVTHIPPKKPHVVLKKSQASRVKQYIDQLVDVNGPGITTSELLDIVDEDLRKDLSSSLSYLRRQGYIYGRLEIGRDTSNAERELWYNWPIEAKPV